MNFMHILLKILLFPFVVVGKFLSLIFGKINWTIPPWMAYLDGLRKTSPLKLVLIIILGVGLTAGAFKAYYYYQSLPEPVLVDAVIIIPEVSDYTDDEGYDEDYSEEYGEDVSFTSGSNADGSDSTGVSSSSKKHLPALRIQFVYTSNALPPEFPPGSPPDSPPELLRDSRIAPPSEFVEFPSIAPIDLVGSEIKSGIKISPSMAGTWKWEDDRTISFVPETPWPAGQEYEVSFAPQVFDTNEEFTSDQFSFVTHPLEGQIEISDFELSVEDKLKQVYVEIFFNYPVDKQSVQQALTMAYQVEGNKLGKPEAYNLSLSDDMRYATAILPVTKLPDEPRIIEVKFDKGIKSIHGGDASTDVYERKIMVPDLYSYLKVEQSNVEVLRNLDNEPEQFVLLSFTDAISRSELLNKFSLYLLPTAKEINGKNYWQSPREITSRVLESAEKVDFEVMPNASEDGKNYQIKIDEQVGRQLYMTIDSGLTSVNGFVHRAYFDRILTTPKYPQEVIISGEGSVLTHSKDQRLAFLTRGISDVQVSIGKVIDDELYHLVSQTHGDISNPNFYDWSFNESNLAEFTKQYISMKDNGADLKTANYASVDLNGLVSKTKEDLGLFFVEIKAWDRKRNREIYGVSDKLLVLVTDLGVIVKKSQDESQDIFVQSINSGKPAAGAKVELIAKNGTKLFSKLTDQAGHVTFPSASGYEREKTPVVYVVKHQSDVSFIPYDRYTRQINYSRFNVGGEYSYNNNKEGVNAYMFTDRGIYRPGEDVNLGMIVKGKNLQNLESIPLELVIHDSQYNEVHVEKLKLAKFGFMDAKFETEKNFKTGTYSASLHLVRNRKNGSHYRERQVGSLSFMVEEFQPDTMSISSQIKGLPNKGWTTSPKLSNEVTLSNLFGVPAQGRRISSELNLWPMAFSFEDYKGVTFYNAQAKDESSDGLSRVTESLNDVRTNADGQASVDVDLSRFTKGTYRVALLTKGFEASGGRSVSTSTSLLYSPSSHLLGYKADGKLDFVNMDSERSLQVIAINNELQAISLEKLTKRISKVQTISTLVKQYNGRYEYESIEKQSVIKEDEYALNEGYQQLILDTQEAGTFVVDIINADDEVLMSVKYTVVGATNDSGQIDKNAELKVTLDASDYQVGDEIEISIQAPYAGSGLITIESNKLHAFSWFSSETKSSVQSIKIPKGIEGNAYVNVTFVRDVNSKEIFTSPLSFAIAPFSIDRSKRVLDINMQVEELVQPGKPMAINLELSEDAKVAVFAVDLGILQVASYSTPNPLEHFLKKRALSVRTMQILDLILPDFALTKMLSAAGGDMEFDKIMVTGSVMRRSENPFERKVQEPAVYWSGVVEATKGTNTYHFNVPNDFAGGLRVMAIAVGEQTMGRAQENTIVRGPFVLTPNVLNQAAPGDEFDITLSVANVVKDSADNAQVSIAVDTSEHVSIVGDASATMELSENQEEAVRFRVKANEQLGGATISFTVNMTDATGKTWSANRNATLSIRPAMPYEVNIQTGAASDGNVSIDTPLQLFEAQSVQMIKASASPLVIAEGLSAYLDEYPHGCTEQIVSQVFPLVGLSNLDKYAPANEKVAAHFAEVITKLRQRQSYAGGFSYWPNSQSDDLDVSLYVMHFLIEAKALAYPVPQDMLEAGIRYLDNVASKYVSATKPSNSEASILSLRNRAQGIYLLTRSGVVTSNLLIDLVSTLNKQNKNTWKQDVLSAYIAASYALMQQDKEANKLIVEYDLSDQTLMVQQAFAGLAPRLNSDAQYLFLVAKHFPEQLKAISEQALLNITQAIYKGQYNTNSAAYSMLALGAYHSALASDSNASNSKLAEIDQTIAFVASSLQGEVTLEPAMRPFASAVYPISTQRIKATIQKSALSNDNALYYVNMQAGYQSQLPKAAQTDGIEIQRAFLDKQGELASNIKQGDELTVRLRVRATELKSIENVAIVDLLPGGFEVIRESINRRAGRWESDYIDIREDRIVFYGNIKNRITEITYKVKVTAAGQFTVPPSFAEAMYDRSLKAYSKASKVNVTMADAEMANDAINKVEVPD
ncbi:MAG: hypothetical protein ACI9O6_000115 [Glaciecola sp.]|jgi:uncharacterized protein YfaS (alpha-2-macroglobulin family)